MRGQDINRIKTISQYHKLRLLSSPDHPLISVIDFADLRNPVRDTKLTFVLDLYSIALKRGFVGKMKYGQREYDFDEGVLSFIAPGQVFSFDVNQNNNVTGFLILFHPDFLWNTILTKAIANFEFFNYSVNEALFLSEREEKILTNIKDSIQQEYSSNIDQFSHDLIISQLASFLIYSDRFYNRQFLSRKKGCHVIVDQVEETLKDYINTDQIFNKGLPTVQYLSDSLNISTNYLCRLLKTLTGNTTQQHIHNKLIEAAKTKLSTTNLSVGEIAREMGFEHSQSFSKLFKAKTKISPLEFRQSFN
ncbi:AraC family transcriptional regulator [Pedobacter frigidisoli]|uniref:AraC family transcriptional regulator n=1 Tax=Pedobacter frigidisoli TaxID=2530455 RepID=A0A4R0NFY5_9SPHI|nr:helix-turn-helix transcriptional regulator [Pedobacter frigidisoli]TCC98132.1 AraC family transcriptional regulator [Pedobacter frigidisoli]